MTDKPGKIVEFTPEKLAAFKRARDKAVRQGKDQFTFDDGTWLVAYAKYVIEYLEGKFK